MIGQCIGQSTGPVAGSRVNDHAGGLIEYDQVGVLVEKIERKVLGYQFAGFRRKRVHIHLLAGGNPESGFTRLPVNQDSTGINPPLDGTPADLFQAVRNE